MSTTPTGDTVELHIGAVSIDCADPGSLADFYGELLGMKRIVETPDGGVVAVSDGVHTLAMMRVAGYVAPSWPEPGQQQQLHFSTSPSPTSTARPPRRWRSARDWPGTNPRRPSGGCSWIRPGTPSA